MAEKEESGFSWSALGNFGMSAFEKYAEYDTKKNQAELDSKLAQNQAEQNAIIAQQNAVLQAQMAKTSGWQSLATNPIVICSALVVMLVVVKKVLK